MSSAASTPITSASFDPRAWAGILIWQPPQRPEYRAQGDAGFPIARSEPDGVGKGGYRFFFAALREQYRAETGIGRGVSRGDADRLPDGLLRLSPLPALLQQHPEQIQRFDMVGLDRQNLLTQGLGFNQVALALPVSRLKEP